MSTRTSPETPRSGNPGRAALWLCLTLSVAFNLWALQRLSRVPPAAPPSAPVVDATPAHAAAVPPAPTLPAPPVTPAGPREAAPAPEKPKSTMADVIAAIENAKDRRRLTALKFDETSLVYGEFFRAEKFDPAVLRRLREKLAERAVFTTAVYAYGADLEQSDRDAISAKLAEQFDAEIAGIIGSDHAARLKQYERTQGPRSITNRWNERVSYFTEPLSVQQRNTLTELLVRQPPPAYPSTPSAEAIGAFREQKRTFGKELLKQATFLSDAQRAALADAMAEDDLWDTPES